MTITKSPAVAAPARPARPARHAMIRVLTEGVSTELTQLQTTDLSTDLIAQPFAPLIACLPHVPGRRGHPRARASPRRSRRSVIA